jgi:hypothetical protein
MLAREIITASLQHVKHSNYLEKIAGPVVCHDLDFARQFFR